jgi:c(7)-type cytochrome triheme protein
MHGLVTRFERLCRSIHGRSLTAPRNAVKNLTKAQRSFANRTIEFRAGALVFLGAAIVLTLITLFSLRASGSTTGSRVESPAPQTNQQMQFPEGLDYAKFLHSSQNHSRLPCLLCHHRDSNAAVPKRPGGSGHLPCAGCHAQQFASTESPICTICHTDVKSGALKPFPRLKSFRMKFDHARHVNMGSVSCNTCHRAARGGVALSIPSGFNAHNTCYRCHTPRAQSGGRDISSCGTCHQLGGYSRTPEAATAFRVSFSHGKHQKVSCNECHQVRAGMPQRRQVTAPEPLNHHATGRGQSCMTCHEGKRAFGGDDFSACKRCHTGKAWRF